MFEILIAQKQQLFGGQFEGFGFLGNTKEYFSSPAATVGLFNKFISVFIGILTLAAGLWFIFQFFIGAFGWLTAGSDKTSLENAQKRLTNAVVGLVIVVAAIFIIDLIGRILGLDILRPGKFIIGIWQ